MAFIIIFLLIVSGADGGNCVGGSCRPKRKQLPAIPAEEMDLLLHLNHRSVQIETPTERSPTPTVRVSLVAQQDEFELRPFSRDTQGATAIPISSSVALEIDTSEPAEIPLPPIGLVQEFITGDVKIRMINDSRLVKYSNIRARNSGEGLGEIQIESDCRDTHVLNRLAHLASILSPLGISNSVLLQFGDTPVGYDPFLDCERTRRAIVWRVTPGLISITEVRRSFPDRIVPIRRAFEIAKMILDMVWRMLNLGVVHGNLTPASVFIQGNKAMVTDLKKASMKPVGSDMRDVRSVFQILVDMNPHLYRQFDNQGMQAQRYEYLKLLNQLRTILMVSDNFDTIHASATNTIVSLVSMF